MPRPSPYHGIFVALIFAIIGFIFLYDSPSYTTSSPPSVVVPSLASSTPIKIEDKKEVTATSTPAIYVQKKVVVKKIVLPPVITPVQTETADEINAKLALSAQNLRSALVNIICSVPAGSKLRSISGSGIIVDPKGIILTNANVSQYFLLADRGVSCVIRSGGPATTRYAAALIYISPAWIKENAAVLTEAEPMGNGKNDFAFLAITKSTNQDALPTTFPYVSLAVKAPVVSSSIVIASYAAQFIASSQISSDLFPTVVYGSIKDVFTFGTNTPDLISLGGTVAAQEGSSGGGVADENGNLVGTITTSTVTGDTSTRSLNAISASYIRADYASETGKSLDSLLAESPSAAVDNFASQIPELEATITAQLN